MNIVVRRCYGEIYWYLAKYVFCRILPYNVTIILGLVRWPDRRGMGKVRGASLRRGNLRGVVRGMQLLVSDFSWTSQFIHFRCLPLACEM